MPTPQVVEPHLVVAPTDGLWRVARRRAPLSPSTIAARDAELVSAGIRRRPGAGVLHLATILEGCFAETRARFRPRASSAISAAAAEDAEEQHLMASGAVPAEWRDSRTIVRVTCPEDVLFVDVDHPATHTHLQSVLAEDLRALGIEEVDVPAVRGGDRCLSRLVPAWAPQPRDESRAGYAGLPYCSRLGEWEAGPFSPTSLSSRLSSARLPSAIRR